MRRSLAVRGKRSYRQRGWKFLHALSIGPGPVRDDERPQGDQMLPPSQQRRRRVCAQSGIGQGEAEWGRVGEGYRRHRWRRATRETPWLLLLGGWVMMMMHASPALLVRNVFIHAAP